MPLFYIIQLLDVFFYPSIACLAKVKGQKEIFQN